MLRQTTTSSLRPTSIPAHPGCRRRVRRGRRISPLLRTPPPRSDTAARISSRNFPGRPSSAIRQHASLVATALHFLKRAQCEPARASYTVLLAVPLLWGRLVTCRGRPGAVFDRRGLGAVGRGVHVAEARGLHGECATIVDGCAAEVLVLQRAEEAFDDDVSPPTPDTAHQRVLAGEGLVRHAAEARAVVRDHGDPGGETGNRVPADGTARSSPMPVAYAAGSSSS